MSAIFALRVHLIDFLYSDRDAADKPSSSYDSASSLDVFSSDSVVSTNNILLPPTLSESSNTKIQLIRGIIHLYRSASSSCSYASVLAGSSSSSSANPLSSPESSLPPARGKLLLVLSIPSNFSPDDFVWTCGSYIEHSTSIRVIRNDVIEDRYSMLVEYDDQKSADVLFVNLNGLRFPSLEGEVSICHVLFVMSVDFISSIDMKAMPPIGSIELPTCPVCIERLDQEITGIVATTCDHSFRCSCISKWATSCCPVCQLCQKLSDKVSCSICETSENLWICVICGFVGCGRYKEGHAIRHWKDTQHCYSLDLETQRVWDYVGDTFVHRLNHSRSDENTSKLKQKCESGEDCLTCTMNNNTETSDAILRSRIEAMVDEYNSLLHSQLETQRLYYEGLLLEEKEERDKKFTEAVDRSVSLMLQDNQAQIETLTKEKKEVGEMNDSYMRTQNLWHEKLKEIIERERAMLKLKDEMICDLEEQIRDFGINLEAQKTIDKMANAVDIRGGTLLAVPAPPTPNPTKSKSSFKTTKGS